jgi:hypothetical protein
MKRIITLLLAFLLLSLPVISYAEQTVYQKEENTGRDKDSYPYIIRMPFATWYLAKADIELLGEDAYYEGLYAVLDEAEADFADARAALEGYIPDEIVPVNIYTDFCGKAGIAANANAYYNGRGNFIKLFNGWEIARISLLHEYVHYLTMHCAQNPTQFGFWAEGIAEYVSNFICKNRLARSENMGFEIAGYPQVMWDLSWNEEENCIDPLKLSYGLGAIAANGGLAGVHYYAVMNEVIVRTDEMEKNLKPQELSMCEASGMIAYLVDTYGRDTVFANWHIDPNAMETVFGKPFSELYREWAGWTAEQCRIMGMQF